MATTPKDCIFIGLYPTGIVYANRTREENGDYKKLGYMNYKTLVLELRPNCPADLAELIKADAATVQAKRGQSYEIAGNMSVILGE
jgi:hypothetical protein